MEKLLIWIFDLFCAFNFVICYYHSCFLVSYFFTFFKKSFID